MTVSLMFADRRVEAAKSTIELNRHRGIKPLSLAYHRLAYHRT
jgi:hypothetical protein